MIWIVVLFLSLWTVSCFHPAGGSPPDAATLGSSGDDPDPPPDEPSTSGVPTTGPATGSSGEPVPGSTGTTAGAPFCGDAVIDPDEECDDGLDNSDLGACTHQCKAAVCGDGLLWKGVEECDKGPENGDLYGGCTLECALGPRCGDGVVDLGLEQCDLGDLNGSGVGVDDSAPCGDACHWVGRLVFISSEVYPGDFSGLLYTDLTCQSLAKDAGLARAEGFRAWISTGFDSPLTRFEQIDLVGAPYILLDGRVVADDFMELVEDGPRTGISITESGAAVFGRQVWTNTSAFSEPFSMISHCAAWTSMDPQAVARRGLNALPVELGPNFQLWRSERHWTSYFTNACDKAAHLYCFQDGLEENAI